MNRPTPESAPSLGDRLFAAAQTLDGAIARHDTVGPTTRRAQPRRRWSLIAAGALATVGVGGLVAVNLNRGTAPPVDRPAGRAGSTQTGLTTDGTGSSHAGPVLPDGWATFPVPPLSPRFGYLSIATGDGIFLWGGSEDSGSSQDGAYYDDRTHIWTVLPVAPLDLTSGLALGVWNGSEVIVLNGFETMRMAAFNPATFTWRELPPPLSGDAPCGMCGRLFVMDDGRVAYVRPSGSDSADRMIPTRVYLFDLATNTWTAGAPASAVREHWSGWASSGRQIFEVSAPADANDCTEATLSMYDPSIDQWSEWPLDGTFTRDVVAWTPGGLLLAGGVSCLPEAASLTTVDLFKPDSGLRVVDSELRVASGDPVEISRWGRSNNSQYGVATNGTLTSVLLTNGQVLTFNSTTHGWQIGPSFLDHLQSFEATPTAWLNDRLVIWSPGIGTLDADGNWACCEATMSAAYAYTPPSIPVAVAETTQRPPVAKDDVLTAPFGELVTVWPLANDFDPDGDLIKIVSFESDGVSVSISVDGASVTFQPLTGYDTTTFQYSIVDSTGLTSSATVTVTVESADTGPTQSKVPVPCGPDPLPAETPVEVLYRSQCLLSSEQRDAVVAWTGRPEVPDEYVIRAGDYPMLIAKIFCTTVDQLAVANGVIDGDFAWNVGTVIRVPSDAACA